MAGPLRVHWYHPSAAGLEVDGGYFMSGRVRAVLPTRPIAGRCDPGGHRGGWSLGDGRDLAGVLPEWKLGDAAGSQSRLRHPWAAPSLLRYRKWPAGSQVPPTPSGCWAGPG